MKIDEIATNSKLRKVAPGEKAFFSLLTLGVCIGVNHIGVSIGILLFMGIFTIFFGGLGFRAYLKLLLIPFSFLLIGVLTIAFGVNGDPGKLYFPIALGDWYFGVSKLGFMEGVRLFFKSLGAVSCLYFLSLTTTIIDLLNLGKRLRMPDLLLELTSLIYRFLFVLMATGETMFTAQESRLGYSGVKASFRSLGALAGTLFIRSYKKSDRIYTAMESRGYEGRMFFLEENTQHKPMNYVYSVGVNVGWVLLGLLLH